MTAVEWLIKEIENILELYPSEWEKVDKAGEQAKAMEKQQIINAWISTDNQLQRLAAEQYYNETFKKEHTKEP